MITTWSGPDPLNFGVVMVLRRARKRAVYVCVAVHEKVRRACLEGSREDWPTTNNCRTGKVSREQMEHCECLTQEKEAIVASPISVGDKFPA